MQYMEIPYVKNKISKIVFGSATDRLLDGSNQNEFLDAVYDLGITTIDTARVYADAEISLGKWIYEKNMRDKIVLLSKCGHYDLATGQKRVNEKEMRRDFEISSNYLKTDYIDIYVLHRDDPDKPAGEAVEIFNAMHAEGKIGAFGGSNWTHQRIEEANEYAYKHNLIPFTVSSPNFGLAEMVNDPWGGGCVSISGPKNKEVRDWYKKNNIAVFAYASLAHGLFSGRIKSTEPENAGQVMDEAGMRGFFCEANIERLRRCEALAVKKNCSVPQLAMAWSLKQDLDAFALVGTSSIQRLQENIAALEISLTEEEMDYLEFGDQPHKRRVRYKGTHPRTFSEKYKEHQPEKYADTIEKVIKKGSTPAGMHISIMVKEVLDFLEIKPGQKGLDCTLGYGGHTRKMVERLEGQGHMYALDVDPIESKKTKVRLEEAGFGPEILTIKNMNFADIDQLPAETGLFDFVLADLGVSSMQIDNPERGFSYKVDGPLDLRLNPEKGVPAWKRLKELNQEELMSMLIENSDEPYAKEISRAVIQEIRKGKPVDTTTSLRELIERALNFLPEAEKKETIKKSCQRTFQALRIDVNSEFEVLDAFLSKLPTILKPGGRVAILTFHSGEDRLVKQYFKYHKRESLYCDVAGDVIRPSKEECARNPRARSTKMRWAIRAE